APAQATTGAVSGVCRSPARRSAEPAPVVACAGAACAYSQLRPNRGAFLVGSAWRRMAGEASVGRGATGRWSGPPGPGVINGVIKVLLRRGPGDNGGQGRRAAGSA